ncbi:MAG: hypothetical protein ACKOEE_14995 [Tagaea sp.]
MTGFDPLAMLDGAGFETEATLDLRGMEREAALAQLRALVATRVVPGPRRWSVRIEPARPGGGETLFQPVGRYLLEAKRARRVFSVAPLADPPGGGFAVDLGFG